MKLDILNTPASRQVKDEMGSFQLQFFEFDSRLANYRYANAKDGKMMKAHPQKWNRFLPKFRYRQNIIVLTQERPSQAGKSGSTYDIVDVFAVLDNTDDLQHFNEQYWTAIKPAKTQLEKAEATVEYIRWFVGVMNTNETPNAVNKSALQAAQNLYLSAQLAATNKELA